MNSCLTTQALDKLTTGDEVPLFLSNYQRFIIKDNSQNQHGKMDTPTSDGREIWQLSSKILRGESSLTKCIPGYIFTEKHLVSV